MWQTMGDGKRLKEIFVVIATQQDRGIRKMPANPINKGKPRFRVNTTVVFFIYSELALYSENTSISLTLHLGRDCRPINKQKKVRLNASIQTDLFYLFIVLVVSRKLFNNCSNLT